MGVIYLKREHMFTNNRSVQKMKVSLNIVNPNANQISNKNNKLTASNPLRENNKEEYSPLYYSHQVAFKGNETSESEFKKNAKQLEEDLKRARTWDRDKAWQKHYNDGEAKVAQLPWYKSGKKIREQAKTNFLLEEKEIQMILKAAKTQNLDDYIRSIKIQESLADFKSKKGGIDDVIAGYQNEKDEIIERIIKPFAAEKAGVQGIELPPALVLYGATGTGKSTLIDAITKSLGGEGDKEIKVIQIDTDQVMFQRTLEQKFKLAAERYIKEGKRTIFLMDEAEGYIDTDPSNIENVRYLKKKLDKCSLIPENANDDRKFATTLLFTTNYPDKIHPDLRTREGKMGEFIAINPPEKADIEAVLKHYVKKAAEALKLRPDADSFSIDPEIIPYDKIAEYKQPTPELGAYSNGRLRTIVEKANSNYLKNPEKPFSTYLGLVFNREKRDLEPERYNEFVRIYKKISPLQPTEIEDLEGLEKMGLLEAEGLERLKYHRSIINSEQIENVAKTVINAAKKLK